METSRDAVNLARSGHPKAVELVRESGQLHGEVLATAVTPPVLLKNVSAVIRNKRSHNRLFVEESFVLAHPGIGPLWWLGH